MKRIRSHADRYCPPGILLALSHKEEAIEGKKEPQPRATTEQLDGGCTLIRPRFGRVATRAGSPRPPGLPADSAGR